MAAPRIAFRNTSGEIVAMMKMAEDSRATGPLDEFQRQVDSDMRGNGTWSPFVDHDAAKRALDRAKMHGRLFVTWAAPEEISEFEKQRHQVN
jgi:hypothetical protein